ncbi:MAG: hypothetical protein EZS28_024318 [Streblomastix strix]|uniref:Uncharacterized protein n=1 Tax=Streblomastix strix TaxID=222440 RepID=A0A5J4VCJ4_9EUKA|nr:MAG: hypothetical protein EZS28_024318 [Streblomastix strix]
MEGKKIELKGELDQMRNVSQWDQYEETHQKDQKKQNKEPGNCNVSCGVPTSGNILTLFADDDPLAVVARIASLITVLFCCPMNSLPARIAIFNIAGAFKKLQLRHKQKKKEEIVQKQAIKYIDGKQ